MSRSRPGSPRRRPARPRRGLRRPTRRSCSSIDVDAEIRKLCGEQLASPAERLVELVRLAIRCGARRVRVQLGLRAASLDAPGAVLPPDALAALATLADPRRPSAERRRALQRCEATHGAGLLALAALPGAVLTSAAGEATWVLGLAAGRGPPHLRSRAPAGRPPPAPRLRIAWRGAAAAGRSVKRSAAPAATPVCRCCSTGA